MKETLYFFDVAYSIDNKQTFKTIAEGISDNFYYWDDPDIATGESIWFKITAYSVDKTLSSIVISPVASSFTLPVQLLNKDQIVIYPNPSSEELIIKLDQNIPSLNYQIVDLNGKIIEAKKVKNIKTLRIKTKNYKSGLYILKLSYDNKSMITKFIVQ